jgi:hypothetical protein
MDSCGLEILKSALTIFTTLASTYLIYLLIIVPSWSALEDYKNNQRYTEQASDMLGEIERTIREIKKDLRPGLPTGMKADPDSLGPKLMEVGVSVERLGVIIQHNMKQVFPDLVEEINGKLKEVTEKASGILKLSDAEELDRMASLIVGDCLFFRKKFREWMSRGIDFPRIDLKFIRLINSVKSGSRSANEVSNDPHGKK